MSRFALFVLLIASATTGLGLSVVFGAVGAYYMAHGIVVLRESSGDLRDGGGR